MIQCKICGETFDKERSLSTHIRFKHKDITLEEYYIKYISKGEHICPVCGKPNKFKGMGKGFSVTCCEECRVSPKGKEIAKQARSKTNKEKFGVENVMELEDKKNLQKENINKVYSENKEEIVKKIKETTLKNNGYENYLQTEEGKERYKQTCLDKYGSDNYFNSNDWKESREEVYKESLGETNPSKLDYIKNKKKETSINNYGKGHYFKTNEWLENSKLLNMEKYGKEFYFQSDEFKEKFDITRKNNYWNVYKLLLENKKIEVLFDKEYYINNNSDFKFRCLKCGTEFSINEYKHPQRIYCKSCCNSISKEETDVLDYIKSLGIKNIESNKRFKLTNDEKEIYDKSSLELDIYLPDYNIGIEYDGVYWHSELYKEDNYHLNKTEYFKSKGIDIIHIFSTEWNNKQDIIKSIIKNKLRLNSTRIFARKCIIKKLDVKTYRDFIIENHIQGYVGSSIKLGLYYEDELVSCIGVGKSRFTNKYELLRMVNKKDTSVIGGFSKLLKYLFKEYELNKLETYCDRRYFNGNGYEKVGFEFDSYTKPAYYYMDKQFDELYNRMNFMKHKLNEKLNDYQEELTERENMLNNNYNRIYDCGNIKYKMEI